MSRLLVLNASSLGVSAALQKLARLELTVTTSGCMRASFLSPILHTLQFDLFLFMHSFGWSGAHVPLPDYSQMDLPPSSRHLLHSDLELTLFGASCADSSVLMLNHAVLGAATATRSYTCIGLPPPTSNSCDLRAPLFLQIFACLSASLSALEAALLGIGMPLKLYSYIGAACTVLGAVHLAVLLLLKGFSKPICSLMMPRVMNMEAVPFPRISAHPGNMLTMMDFISSDVLPVLKLIIQCESLPPVSDCALLEMLTALRLSARLDTTLLALRKLNIETLPLACDPSVSGALLLPQSITCLESVLLLVGCSSMNSAIPTSGHTSIDLVSILRFFMYSDFQILALTMASFGILLILHRHTRVAILLAVIGIA